MGERTNDYTEAGRSTRAGIRWGLCCLFVREPIRFGIRQAAYLARLNRARQLALLAATVRANGEALVQAIRYCHSHGIGAFRVNSRLFPLKTHPELGYRFDDLPDHVPLLELYHQAGAEARRLDVRLSFHPDQFTLLSSPDAGVNARSLAELAYHAEAAEMIGADVITLHGGGVYGDKPAALERLTRAVERLPEGIRSRLVLENDDRLYTPADLLPLCKRTGIPFVYDVHHHRCHPDGLGVEETTMQALATWSREPLFHLSSPRAGWSGGDPRPHHDFIDPDDIPACWLLQRLTVEVEAKAKEQALARLLTHLGAATETTTPAA